MDSSERVAIFIDGSNFYHGLKANLVESADFRGFFENEIRVFAEGFLSMLSYADYSEEA